MTKYAGIDIGSRTVKIAVIENDTFLYSAKSVNSFDPLSVCRELMKDLQFDSIVATGYGRHIFKSYFHSEVISEITAFAKGARFFFPNCRTILDIGGQDTKAISLDASGRMIKFEMNDKCAAGTGRFLEVMAASLGYSMQDFIQAALSAEKSQKISSMCTVFAESELISLTAKGTPRADLALGIHESIVSRSISMLRRLSIEEDIVFAGGVALNPCMCQILEKEIGFKLHIPDDPQIIGAIGSALLCRDKSISQST